MVNKTVLVVDDSELNRKLIRTLLGTRSIGVMEAENAEQALQLIQVQRPDLILMDVQLPGMDGLEATRVLKADIGTAGIPVVILSAGSLAHDDAGMQEAGCAGLISKPFAAQDFLDTVASHL